MTIFSNFCCCCRLETGGLIIGWYNAILSFIGIIVSISMIILGFTDLSLLVVGIIYLLYFVIYFGASINLIIGVNRREASRMVLFMILMLIGVIISFISIWADFWSGLIWSVIFSLIQLYFFLCIYSLYRMLKG